MELYESSVQQLAIVCKLARSVYLTTMHLPIGTTPKIVKHFELEDIFQVSTRLRHHNIALPSPLVSPYHCGEACCRSLIIPPQLQSLDAYMLRKQPNELFLLVQRICLYYGCTHTRQLMSSISKCLEHLSLVSFVHSVCDCRCISVYGFELLLNCRKCHTFLGPIPTLCKPSDTKGISKALAPYLPYNVDGFPKQYLSIKLVCHTIILVTILAHLGLVRIPRA